MFNYNTLKQSTVIAWFASHNDLQSSIFSPLSLQYDKYWQTAPEMRLDALFDGNDYVKQIKK